MRFNGSNPFSLYASLTNVGNVRPAIVLTIAIIAFTSSACVSRSPKVEVPEQSQRNNPVVPWSDQQGQYNGNDRQTVSMTFSESDLRLKFNLNTTNLSYKFSYLDRTENNSITFTGGSATITISRLKPNTPGTVKLEIYEGSALKLQGMKENFTLTPGQNTLQLELLRVGSPTPPGNNNINPNPQQPQDTSLTINVTLEDTAPQNNVQPPQNNVQPPQNNVQPPQNNVQPPQNNPWNGIGDRGNENWNIESIE
jgi:hypothetical protein